MKCDRRSDPSDTGQRFLRIQRQIYVSQGNQEQIQRIDARLQNNAARRVRARAIGQAMDDSFAGMSEDQMLRFIASLRTSGEVPALLELPGIRAAVAE